VQSRLKLFHFKHVDYIPANAHIIIYPTVARDLVKDTKFTADQTFMISIQKNQLPIGDEYNAVLHARHVFKPADAEARVNTKDTKISACMTGDAATTPVEALQRLFELTAYIVGHEDFRHTFNSTDRRWETFGNGGLYDKARLQ
jgi:hypothetical protein